MKQRPKFRAVETQFENLTKKDNENEDNIELLPKPQPIVEMAITEGDTLQALSIRYRCSVAELRRLNNLHRDNEIFARRTIKIPYRAFSMVAVHKSGDSSPDTNLCKKTIDATILKQKLTSVSNLNKHTELNLNNGFNKNDVDSSNPQPVSDNGEMNFNQIIFNTNITSKEESEDINEGVSDEEVQLIPSIEINKPVTGKFSCSGADWGLSWPFLLALILIVALLGPLILIYVFHIAEHTEKYHHHS